MPDDLFASGLEQFSRAVMMPWRMFSRPSNDAVLEALKQRNVLLDTLFYDVRRIEPDEAVGLAPWKVGEGAVLIVPPSGAGRLELCETPDAVFARDDVTTLTVAGVGSSALGTAAFARNVADAVGRPVVAVVSGYGLADLAGEAASGLRWFAGLAALQDLWTGLDRSLDRMRSAEAGRAEGEPASTPTGRAAEVVEGLVADDRGRFDLIVGHSKGNLVVCDALHALQRKDRARCDRLGETVAVVAVSSRLRMPRSCRRVIEIVGRWDRVGDFASRRDAPPDIVVPDAWHHTNTDLYGHLPVTRVLKEVLAKDRSAIEG